MKPGDLVRVRWGGTRNQQGALGVVVSYEPDCYGGSTMYTARCSRGSAEHMIDTNPRRGRVLVLHPETGNISWWDEQKVEIVGEEDGM